ncbi:DUF7019 family protein [Streptomyces parvus]|uniref:DUF7019 family protein n=1 Tax=Streptomyces parvus TaxID=66428 RepID=UPI0035E10D40
MPGILKRPGDHPLRPSYLYVSRTELKTLVPQLPALTRLALEARIKVSTAVYARDVKGFAPDAPPELAAKASVIGGYLEKRRGEVSAPSGAGRYVKGVMSLRCGVLRDYAAELAFFGGEEEGVRITLVGSPAGLVGTAVGEAADHGLDYYALQLLVTAAENGRGGSEWSSIYEAVADGALSAGVLPSAPGPLEFLAKPLFRSDRLLVATPVYVTAPATPLGPTGTPTGTGEGGAEPGPV